MIMFSALIPIIVYYTAKSTGVKENLLKFSLKPNVGASILDSLRTVIKNFVELMHVVSFRTARFH